MWVDDSEVERLRGSVDAIDLAGVVEILTEMPGGLRHPLSDVHKAIRLYRIFLVVKGLHWKRKVVPSPSIDLIWHTHILQTTQYRQDCRKLFGKFLDHDPFFGTRSDEELRQYRAAKHWTKSAVMWYFGVTGEEYTCSHLVTAAEAMAMLSDNDIGGVARARSGV